MRFAEIRRADRLPKELTIAVGDVLMVEAGGFTVISSSSDDDKPVGFLGPLTRAAVGTDDSIVTPSAQPGIIIVAARREGEVVADFFRRPASGPPGPPVKERVRIVVSAADHAGPHRA